MIRNLVWASALTLSLSLGFPPFVSAESFNERQRQEIEKIVRDYLLKNPETLLDAARELEARKQEAERKQLSERLQTHRQALERDPHSYVGGNPKGDVTLIEFFDYRCPYCRQMLDPLERIMAQDGKLRVVYKEFPILGSDSEYAARAAIASLRQKRGQLYKPFHAALYRVRGELDQNAVLNAAKGVGLDLERLQADMNDPKIATIIEANRELAFALGLTGTPSFIIGDEAVRGAIAEADLKDLIALARTGCRTC
jgi:protein-disulfide isomerase